MFRVNYFDTEILKVKKWTHLACKTLIQGRSHQEVMETGVKHKRKN